MTMTWNRPTDLHVEYLADATLVYDLAGAQIHCLTDNARLVFDAVQHTSAEGVAQATGLSVAQTQAELASLHERGLITTATGTTSLSRKAMMAGALGAGVGILTMAAPTPAAAASGTGPILPAPPNSNGGAVPGPITATVPGPQQGPT